MDEYYYFTFGCGSKYGNRQNKYVKIPGDQRTSRSLMMRYYGSAWCSQYSEKQFMPLKERYNWEEYNENINFLEVD